MKRFVWIVGLWCIYTLPLWCDDLAIPTKAPSELLPEILATPNGSYQEQTLCDAKRVYTVYVKAPAGLPKDTVDIYQWFMYRKGVWSKVSSCNGRKTYSDSLSFMLNNVSEGETIYFYRDAFVEDKSEPNNIVNGDFESGDEGFRSDYDYREPQKRAFYNWDYTYPLNPEGVYTVDVGMNKNHSSSTDCNTDHTYGVRRLGKAMWINGGSDANTIVWQQVIPIKAGRNYMFSVWALNWSYYPLAKLQWFIDTRQIGAIENPPAEKCVWKRIATVWNSGTTNRNVVLSLRNQVTQASGNDFAIDDIALRVMTHEPFLAKVTFCQRTDEYLCGKDTTSIPTVVQHIQKTYPCPPIGSNCKWQFEFQTLLHATRDGGSVPIELYADCNFAPNNFVSGNYRVDNVLLTIEKTIEPTSSKKFICEGESYKWPWNTPKYNGVSFSTTGIYRDTVRYPSGCDKKYYELDLHVLPVFPTKELDTTICQSVNVVNWNIDGRIVSVYVPTGKTFVTKDYYVPYKAHGACDSVKLRLNVHVDTDPTTAQIDTTLCYGQELLWPTDEGYKTIKSAGTYTIITKRNRLCPKTTFLTVRYSKPPKTQEVLDGVCKGSDYTWQTYRTHQYTNVQTTTDYFDTLHCKHSTCDSIYYHLHLEALMPVDVTLYDTICERDMPYRFQPVKGRQPISLNQSRTDSTHNITFAYEGKNCDSVHYTLNLHIYKSTVVQRDTSVPYGAIFKWTPFKGSKGQYIKQVTTESFYYDTLRAKDKRRCDSIRYVLHVTSFMPNGKFFEDIVCAGETYQWRRESYLPAIPIKQEYDVRDYVDTVRYRNMPTVDSAYYYLHLTVKKATNVEFRDTICAGSPYYWRDLNNPILLTTSVGDYYDTLRNTSTGCDSIYYHLRLIRQNFTTIERTDTVCGSDTYLWTTDKRNVPKVITEGLGWQTYYDTARTTFGCDSIRYVLHLLRRERIEHVLDTTIGECRLPYKWYTRDPIRPIFVTTLDRTETLLHRVETLPYADGRCDSMWYELTLHINRPVYITEEDTVCEIKQWYTTSKNYYRTIVATRGFETFRDTARSVDGCDSVIYVLKLWASPPKYVSFTDTICGDDTYYWDRRDGRPKLAIDGQEKYSTHYDTLLRKNGCDSVRYTLHLVRLAPVYQYKYDTICHDESYDWYDAEGRLIRRHLIPPIGTTNYGDTIRYRGTRKCDSLICLLALTRQPVFYNTLTDTICGNTDYVWTRMASETTYYDTIRQTIEYNTYRDTIRYVSTGCDSAVYVLNLLRRDVRVVSQDVSLCGEEDYDWYTDDKTHPYQTIHAKDHLDADTSYYYTTYYMGTKRCDSVLYELNVHTNVITLRDTIDTVVIGTKYVWTTHDKNKPMNIYCPNAGRFEYNDKASYTNGCDSVRYHLQLLVQDYTYRRDTDTVCSSDTYFWSTDVTAGRVIEIPVDSLGQDFYDTTFYTGTKHIDSVRYTLHLVRQKVREVHTYDTICFDGDYTWNVNGHSFYIEHPSSFLMTSETVERSDTAFYMGTHQCDSVRFYLHLLRHRIYYDIEYDTTEATICYGATYNWVTKDPDNPTPIKQLDPVGVYTDAARFTGSAHCDSIQYQLTLHVVQPTTIKCDTFCCEGNDFEWYLPTGEGWREGRPTWQRPAYTNVQQGIIWVDTVKSFKTECGEHCDSIYYILYVNVIRSQYEDEEVTICAGDSFEWHTWRTQYLHTDGVYTDASLNSATKCPDRSYKLTLHVISPDVVDEYDTLCAGDTKLWKPNAKYPSRFLKVTESGDYTITIQKDLEPYCDSLVYNLHMTFLSLREDEKRDTVCIPYTGKQGVTYDWYGTDGTFRQQIDVNRITPVGDYFDEVSYMTTTKACDSVHYHLHLDLQQAVHKVISDTLCEDSIYRLRNENGEIVTTFKQTATTEQIHYFNVPFTEGCKSCDSVNYEVHLVRQPVTIKYDTAIIIGDESYTWHYSDKQPDELIPSQTTATGDYGPHIETYSGTNACDSAWYFLHLIRYDTYVQTESKTLCIGDDYDWYTSDENVPTHVIHSMDILADDTTYSDTLRVVTRGTKWDSVQYHLNVHINRVSSREQTDTVSIDSLYRWQPDSKSLDQTITPNVGLEDYTYTSYYTTGCDSVHYTLHLLCQDYTVHCDTDTVCGDDTYNWYTEGGLLLRTIPSDDEGDYFDTLHYVGTHHCDSVRYSLHLLRQRPTHIHRVDTVCGDETYYWETYTDKVNELHPTLPDNDFFDTAFYSGTHKCDSICYSIHLVRQDTTIEQIIDTVCDWAPYQWYTKTGIFIREIRQQETDGDYEYITYYDGTHHCEKIHYRLHLHVNKPIFSDEQATFCQGEPYTWYNTDSSIIDVISQQASLQYHSALSTYTNGCDSVYHTLQLSMLYPSKGWEYATICYGQSFDWHGYSYMSSTTEMVVIPNAVGCDSVCTLILTVLPQEKHITRDTILCVGSYLDWYGQRIIAGGTYDHYIQNFLGCDSIHLTLRVAVHDTTTTFDEMTMCYQDLPCYWHSRKYYEPGEYTDTLINSQGCDSICHLSLHVSEPIEYCFVDTLLCLGHTMDWHGRTITKQGVYRDTFRNQTGCDSVLFQLNVDTIDCCIHLRNVQLVPQGDICGDDAKYDYRFLYTSGKPDSFSVSFEQVALTRGFQNQHGYFVEDSITPSEATVQVTLPQVKPFIRPSEYNLYLEITDTCGTMYSFYDTLQVLYPSWVIDQHWNDVLAVLAPQYIMGYSFYDYQWYKNDTAVVDAIGDHYYMPSKLSQRAEYRVRLTRTDDDYTTFTCPVTIHSVSDSSVLRDPYIFIYPSVVSPDDPRIHIITNMYGDYWIYDLSGKIIDKGAFTSYDYDGGACVITAPATPASYVLYAVPDKNQKLRCKPKGFVIIVR